MSDIVINEVTYKNVDSITVNKATGGTAKYTEGERPSGTIEITENGLHNVKDYANANVNVPTPDLSQTTATADDVLEGKEFFNASGEKVAGTYKDMLQARVDLTRSCDNLFDGLNYPNIEFAKNLDTKNALSMKQMFSGSDVEVIPLLDTRNVKDMSSMFERSSIKTIPQLDMSSVTTVNNMFYRANSLETLPPLNTKKVEIFTYMLNSCTKLTTVSLNLIKASNTNNIFAGCTNLTNLTLKNIKISLYITASASYGHLLTLESLLNTFKELWTNTATSTKTLTIGTTNIAKLENVYVKLVDITDEMRAEDEYIDNKAPFVQCESTDEGAMLITEYVTTVKKWTLA